jgi:hypothetical protein
MPASVPVRGRPVSATDEPAFGHGQKWSKGIVLLNLETPGIPHHLQDAD